MFNAATVMVENVFLEPPGQDSGYDRLVGRDLGLRLIERLGRAPDACWLFCSPGEGLDDLLQGVNDTIDTDNLVGCTTDGEISSAGFSSSSAVLGGIVSDQIDFHIASITGLGTHSEENARRLGEMLPRTTQYAQVFSDGLTGNGSAILRGLNSSLEGDIPIAGGGAGDAGRFLKTWQFHGRRLLSDSAVCIGFSGNFTVGTGVKSGWAPVGLDKRVTRAQGNVVYELDGRPALEVYKRFLGKHADKLPAVGVEYPFGLMDESGNVGESDYFLLRAPMTTIPEEGAISFAGEVPEGSVVRLTCGDHGSILHGSRQAAQLALEDMGDVTPAMVFFYSCTARRIVLGMRTPLELEQIRHVFGADVPILGFYTYGEYCRVRRGGASLLHNETATISVIGVHDA